MSYKLVNGDYIKSEDGKIVTAELCEELLQNAIAAIKAHRGKFYPNKNFGSMLYSAKRGINSSFAEALARQALDEIDGVFVEKAETDNDYITIYLAVNDEKRTVSIPFENNI